MKPPLPKRAAAAAAQEERWRKLQEYLAAKGKLKQPSTKPYLKDKTNQQNLIPSKSDPTARCKKSITLNKTKGEQKKETTKYSVPASRGPQSRSSSAPASQKPQNAPSGLSRKGPRHALPSKASADNLTRKQSTTISSKYGLCQGRKTNKLEPVTEPRTQALQQTAKSLTHPNHPGESRQEKAFKDNLGSQSRLGLEKKEAAKLGLPSGSQTMHSRPNAGFASQGSMPAKRQAQTYQATKSQVQRNPRGPSAHLKGADLQKRVPRVPGALVALKVGQSSIRSRPEMKCRGVNPRATKQGTNVLRPQKENAAQSRTGGAPGALQTARLKQQRPTPCKAQPVRRHPSNSCASKNRSVSELRGKRTLPLAARDGINKCGSSARRNQSSKKLQQVKSLGTANRITGTLRCERTKSRQLGMGTGQEPKTPCTQDRRKLLEQWLKSQGKSYKRPPMTLPAAKPRKKRASLNQSFWNSLGEEEERTDRSLIEKISSTLTECLKLAEEGFPSEEILAMLSQIPEAEKFAQFWICKANLLARHGTFDVAGLYEAAVRAGAVPLQKLKEVVVDLLKNPGKTTQEIPAQVSPLPARDQAEMSPPSTVRRQAFQPVSGIKLQVVPLPRVRELCAGPDTKLLTPVRRSLRIEGASAGYPEMLKDHNTVVASLDELLPEVHGSLFVFRKNEALPEEAEGELLRW
ncbi:cytoskeleton-associated protein 2-like [Paroedura picta]|uniref:cytoskeleton-associated protein 2-like n=1 Tax=Paroedura picta TaxID=143630 RepID=UPI0010151659